MDDQTRQQVANFHYGLIAPLVSRKLEAGEQMALMRVIVSHVYETPAGEERRISLRTLERYVQGNNPAVYRLQEQAAVFEGHEIEC